MKMGIGQYHAQKEHRKLEKRAVALSKRLGSKNCKKKVILFIYLSGGLFTKFPKKVVITFEWR